MSGFTSQELELAKSVDLVAVAASLGYTPKKIGRDYTLKEMDSIRIYDRSHWYRWSRAGEKGHDGGSQIDFLREFGGLDIKDAVFWLLDFAGYQRVENGREEKKPLFHVIRESHKEQEKRNFVLPVPNKDNRRVREYLYQKRKISYPTIDRFIDEGLLYESRDHHNAVFQGKDKDGNTRFASMRGTYDPEGGKPFKCDVAGNDKHYGFNVTDDEGKMLLVFEGAIDLMSFADMFRTKGLNMLALGMVADAPLERFLEEHAQIETIVFCLDNDEAGRKATEQLMQKYYELGYEVKDGAPRQEYKDYNEWLVAKRNAAEEKRTLSSGSRDPKVAVL